jgi:uncharacterized protein
MYQMIHRYQLNGYNIVLDVYSGSVHAVDPLAYDIIGLYDDVPADEITARMIAKYRCDPQIDEAEIRECLSDVAQLKARGKLFAKDPFAGAGLPRKAPSVKALCLHVAHTCNLNCEYCFAGQGHYQGDRALMRFEVGAQAIDFLIAHSGSHRMLDIDFFGGEPLVNWDVVKDLVAYARGKERQSGKKFRFTLTTNGVLVDDEVIEFSNREMHNVVLSLDGRRQVHDRLRRDCSGGGSYDRILPGFRRFARSRNEQGYYVRGTFTHLNTDFTQDILHIADLGFTQISMEPVVAAPSEPYALTDQDLPVLLDQYEQLALDMLRRQREGRGFTFYHYMMDLAHGPCLHKRMTGCGSGTEYFAVTPWGDLYPCHQFVSNPDMCMGNVQDGVTNHELTDAFLKCDLSARPECQDCWAKLYCSGGCAANAYHATGQLTGIYEYGCKLFRKRIECAIMIKVAQAAQRGE